MCRRVVQGIVHKAAIRWWEYLQLTMSLVHVYETEFVLRSLMAWGKKLLLSLSVFAIMLLKRLPDGSKQKNTYCVCACVCGVLVCMCVRALICVCVRVCLRCTALRSSSTRRIRASLCRSVSVCVWVCWASLTGGPSPTAASRSRRASAFSHNGPSSASSRSSSPSSTDTPSLDRTCCRWRSEWCSHKTWLNITYWKTTSKEVWLLTLNVWNALVFLLTFKNHIF